MAKNPKINWRLIGPGIVLAAAGVGAGDIVASGVAGASFGMALLWAVLVGAIFKFFLNEGMARYQLATGKTFMEGYTKKCKYFNYYFIVYLVVWSFIVGGALLSGMGVVTNSMFPIFSLKAWAVINAIVVMSVIMTGTYKIFERIMKFLAGVMFLSFVISAIAVFPSFIAFFKGLFIPIIPAVNTNLFDSVFKVLAVLGGVGGTVTIMAYSYWIRENKITSPKQVGLVRLDLGIGYFITFVFGVCVMIVAAALIHPVGGQISGKQGIIYLAQTMSSVLGPLGFWSFMIGFWAAIFSSLMSFYQAIPYLFCDAIRLVKKKTGKAAEKIVSMKSAYYKGYVIYCFLPPMLLLFLDKPVFLILLYTVMGAFFMPFLALMLLIIGNDNKLGKLKNQLYHNFVLVLVFVVMIIVSFWPLIKKYILT